MLVASNLATKDDNWIENRILWKASKNGLPGRHTFAYPDWPASTIQCAEFYCIGKPVLAFIGDNTRWTLLGTQKLLSSYDEKVIVLSLVEMESVSYFTRDLEKQEMEYLSLTAKGQGDKVIIWAPKGNEYFTLFGILLMFCQ
jgi:hypothetical protein